MSRVNKLNSIKSASVWVRIPYVSSGFPLPWYKYSEGHFREPGENIPELECGPGPGLSEHTHFGFRNYVPGFPVKPNV